MALRKVPHPEEAPKGPSRRTHGANPVDRQFPDSLLHGDPWTTARRLPPLQAGSRFWVPAFAGTPDLLYRNPRLSGAQRLGGGQVDGTLGGQGDAVIS